MMMDDDGSSSSRQQQQEAGQGWGRIKKCGPWILFAQKWWIILMCTFCYGRNSSADQKTMKYKFIIEIHQNVTLWPSGLRRCVKAAVFWAWVRIPPRSWIVFLCLLEFLLAPCQTRWNILLKLWMPVKDCSYIRTIQKVQLAIFIFCLQHHDFYIQNVVQNE